MAPRIRMTPRTCSFLKMATSMARFGFRLPHCLVTTVTNRGWEIQTADGWQSIRIDNQGRMI